MAGIDSNLLKLDMQIISKRLKIRDKKCNILQDNSRLQKGNAMPNVTQPLQYHHGNTITSKKSCKENPQTLRVQSKKRKAILRRPVNYTWNRGGRLKEIRIRTQARKFLYLWISKTFGKITFSQAHRFHQKKLLAKCFNSLKFNWWENCGEMKLFIRAEYFNRYQIYGKTWILWKYFVKLKKQKKQFEVTALTHYSQTSNKKFFNLWKIYIQLRRTKKNLYNQGYVIANNNLIRKFWSEWCLSLQKKRKFTANFAIAASHRSNTVLKQKWRFWLLRYAEKMHEKKLNNIAYDHQKRVLMKTEFWCWQKYVCYRRRKYALYAKAKDLYSLSLKHKTICMWWTRYEQLLISQDRMFACNVLCAKFTKRRFFLSWIQLVEMNCQKRRKLAISHIFYRNTLKKSALKSLQFAVDLRRRKIAHRQVAQKLYTTKLMKASWAMWQRRIEFLEDQELSEMSSVAKEHYRWKLLKNSFAALKAYKVWKKSRKCNFIKAEAHFIVKALPRYFNTWRKFVVEVKDVNQMKKDASTFCRELLLTKYFYNWYSEFEQANENRTRERMAVMQQTENCLRHHFSLWLVKARSILSSNHNDAVARVNYRRSLLKLAIRRWKKHAENSLVKQRKWYRAVIHHREGARAGAWLKWRSYVAKRREKHNKHAIATTHYSHHLQRMCIQSWLVGVKKAKETHYEAERRCNRKRHRLVRSCFDEWKSFTASSIAERESYEKAEHFANGRLRRLVLSKWREWTIVNRFQAAQKQDELDEARSALNRFKSQRMFAFWKARRVAVRRDKCKLFEARRHYSDRVCRVVLQAWQLHRYISLKKSLMRRQASLYRNSLLLQVYTARWRSTLLDKQDEAVKTGDALWHWAMSLQGRCFDNWRKHIAERKRKKERYDGAMDARRAYMMKEGCVKMLEYHSRALARRTQLRALQHAEARYTGYHLAWKYGKRWIAKVREKTKPKEVDLSFCEPRDFVSSLSVVDRLQHSPPPSKKSNWLPDSFSLAKERFSSHDHVDCYNNKHRSSPEKYRPPPRLPEFLDDSLRRDGLVSECFTGASTLVSNRLSARTYSPVPLPSASCKTPPNEQSASVPFLGHYARQHPSSSRGNSEKSPSVLLLPPSAFNLPTPDSSPPRCSIDASVPPNLDDDRSSSSGGSDAGSSRTLTERKDTFKTFVASSPSTDDRDELKSIYKKLQEFQDLRNKIKVLKQQKDVLENWIDENVQTMSTSKSLDMVAVQEEIVEIDEECARISKELLARRPEVENLAVRVKVLCARPK